MVKAKLEESESDKLFYSLPAVQNLHDTWGAF